MNILADYEPRTVKQTRGPRIKFLGKLLEGEQWTTKGHRPLDMLLEVWQTPAGALVATSSSVPVDGGGIEDLRAFVADSGVEAARDLAIMDFFDWDNHARTMAKRLGWSMTVEVA
mgnify:CR=1 FL=1